MKAFIELATGHGMAVNAQTVSDVEYYEGVDIYDAEGVVIEKCRFFPIGTYGSPDPIPDGLKAFFVREFPADNTDVWPKEKRIEWWAAAGVDPEPFDDMTLEEMDINMVFWAVEHNYPTGRE